MGAFPLIEPETATGDTAGLLEASHEYCGVTANMIKAMANSPAALKAYLDFSCALRGGSLPIAVREGIALLVAQQNGCDYSLSARTFFATKLGRLSDAAALHARRGESADPQAAAALALTGALLNRRGSVTDADLAAAGALTPAQLVEVIAHVAINVFTTYLCQATRIDVDWPLVRHTD